MARDSRFYLKPNYVKSRALVIGINDYQHTSPLGYAVSDAESIFELLTTTLGFDPADVTLLTDHEANRSAIKRAYLRFAAADVNSDDRIIVFYAGHGCTVPGARGEIGYLVPVDGDPKDLSTLIRWDELTRDADLIRAKHLFFILDACFGGLAFTRHSPGTARFVKDMMVRFSRQVLTAGKADEVVADANGPIPGHSIFTGHLLEGLQGKAIGQDGLLTASGIMAYVYDKVAKDNNSDQTPGYGHIDGDGEFFLLTPQLTDIEKLGEVDVDAILTVPFPDDSTKDALTGDKLKTVKSLLGSETTSIELHDYMIAEVRRFLARTSEDYFKLQGQFSDEELIRRIERYENIAFDLAIMNACIAYWARPAHKQIMQKTLARSTDLLGPAGGNAGWLSLRWYPIVIQAYCAGIAAVSNQRYDSLHTILAVPLGVSDPVEPDQSFVGLLANAIVEMTQHGLFKRIPGHERHYTPMSEYLFKSLQPKLDDAFFLGRGYERAFDEFEVLLALSVADHRVQANRHLWGPVGRFGWKEKSRFGQETPFARILAEGKAAGNNWAPLQAGLFGGSASRFDEIAVNYGQQIAQLNWY